MYCPKFFPQIGCVCPFEVGDSQRSPCNKRVGHDKMDTRISVHRKESGAICQYLSLLALMDLFEPRYEKTCPGFPTRSYTNYYVQPKQMTRGLKFGI